MGRLQIGETKKSATHEVALGLVEENGVNYAIDLVRSLRAPEGKFLAGSVKVDAKEIWSFKKTGYNGICTVTEVGDKVIFCFLSYDKKLEWVVPVDYLKNLQVVEGEFITSLNMSEVIALKRLVARKIGAEAKFSPLEAKVSAYFFKKQRDDNEALKLEKLRRKEEKRNKIMAREIISAYTNFGAGRFGRPVVGDEWHCLDRGTFVILVESFNEETGECGSAIEAFAVRKGNGGKAEKENATKVTDMCPPVRRRTEVKAGKAVVFDIDGAFRSVPVYKTMDEIRQAREAGLNGGTFATAEDRQDDKGCYTLFVLGGSDNIKTLGSFRPL